MKIVKLIFKWLGILLLFLGLIFIVLLIVPEKETVTAIQPRSSTQYWDMQEGFRIAYTHLAAPDSLQKTPVVFLHGGPGGYVHSSIIKTLSPLAGAGHDLYFYDQRGSGLSDRLPKYSDISFERHLSDLHEIITTKIKAPQVILIGQSFGCNIISHYSVRHPETIVKIIFSSPGEFLPYRSYENNYVDLDSLYPTPDSLPFIQPYRFVEDVNKTAFKPKAIIATTGALLFDKKLVSDRQMDRTLNTLASKFTKGMVCDPARVLPEEGGGGLYAYIASNTSDLPEIRDQIPQVKSPVLVIQGQCDYIPFSAAIEYVDLYPNAQYAFVKAAGHEIWWEQQEIYLKTIQDFLTQ